MSEINGLNNQTTGSNSNYLLELKNVTKIYTTKAGDTAALDGVSLVFPESGMVFITGKSGSGKTTMLNVIGGLDGIDSGEIYVGGKRFSEFTAKEYDSYRNSMIGFVFQEYNLLPDYTIEKNIGMANELQGKKTDKDRLNKLLEKVGVENYIGRKPNQLSGGQKQRIAIVRALIKDPKIIMADEPTGALDSVTGIQVMEELKELSKEKLVICVSHDLELAKNYADRIIRLVDGKIAEDVEVTDVEVKSNVYVSGDAVIVKSGADLTDSDTVVLKKAIKENKKISSSKKLSIREKKKTDESRIKPFSEKVKFVSSKMKYKSAAELGIKSLGVKPLRLIFTVLLSAVAFAVFGVFDTMAGYQRSKVLADLLSTGEYTTVSAVGTYISETGGEPFRINLSKDTIGELSSKTGYNFKGVYHIGSYVESAPKSPISISKNGGTYYSYDIKNAGGKTLSNVPFGGGYYNPEVNGFIEFGANEITPQLQIPEYGYKVIAGTYPKLEYDAGVLVPESLNRIAISTYVCDSLMHAFNGNVYNKTFFTPIPASYEDFIGKKVKFGTNTKQEFTIVGVIDCGAIPSKFDVLKQDYELNTPATLRAELESYINTQGHLLCYVGEGFISEVEKLVTRPVVYYNDDADYTTDYDNDNDPQINLFPKATTSSEFLRAGEFTYKNVVLFDDPEKSTTDAVTLNKGEVLLHVKDLDVGSGLFKYEIEKLNATQADRTLYQSYFDDIMDIDSTEHDVRQAVGYMYSIIKKLWYNEGLNQNYKTIYLHKTNSDTDYHTQYEFKVVGVYFDINYTSSQQFQAYMLGNEDLNMVGAYAGQGNYARIFGKIASSKAGASKLASYMTAKKGLGLQWYGNTVLETLEEQEDLILSFSDLFLYAALVLALFSIFMLFNYISTSIVSKRQSIGVLRALGSGGADVFKMFITESLVISLINGIFASGIAALACFFVNLYLKEVVHLVVNFAIFGVRQIIVIFVISIITGVVSSIMPIIKIAKEKPVDLIRRP